MAKKNVTEEEKVRFARQQVRAGVRAPAQVQKLVKQRFGRGLNFRDLKKVFGTARGGRKQTARARAGRTRRGAAKPSRVMAVRPVRRGPGRPPKVAPRGTELLLLVGGQHETCAGKRELERRVAEHIARGVSPQEMAVYQRVSLSVKADVRV